MLTLHQNSLFSSAIFIFVGPHETDENKHIFTFVGPQKIDENKHIISSALAGRRNYTLVSSAAAGPTKLMTYFH
jgi:hypothetical protein